MVIVSVDIVHRKGGDKTYILSNTKKKEDDADGDPEGRIV